MKDGLPPLPPKENKVEQHNFAKRSEALEWLHRNGYTSSGMLTERPYAEFFVERFDKDGFIALFMNITYINLRDEAGNPRLHDLSVWDKPYQVDVATI